MISILLIITLLSFNIPVFATDSSSLSQLQTDRLAGQNRYETSAEITKSGWTNSDYAIIASGEDFPDALCGAPLAQKYNAPILLTANDSLDEQSKNQLLRLKVKNVFIIGGVGVISSNVEQDIKNMGIEVSRIAGNDRYETSLKVAQTMGQFTQAVIATGENFPDALSIAPIAAIKGIPILLTPKENLPEGLKEFINNNVQSTYVVGGITVISDNVLNQLPSPKRLSGINRYETNISVIKEFTNELDFSNCYIGTGENFSDALAGSALVSLTKSPIILVSNPVDQSTKDLIKDNISSIKKVIVFGEKSGVPESVLISIQCDFNNSDAKLLESSGVQNKINIGDAFKVVLKGNPTTGYIWHYSIENSDIVKLDFENYVRDSNIVGAGNTYTWNFKALKTGDTKIIYKYYRDWEGESSTTAENIIEYLICVNN